MKRFVAFAVSVVAGLVLCLGVTTAPVSASVVDVNFGACMSSIDNYLKPYQAPGKSGNGPLTIVNGNIIVPSGFAGAVGCSH